jgi:hypothetical protein
MPRAMDQLASLLVRRRALGRHSASEARRTACARMTAGDAACSISRINHPAQGGAPAARPRYSSRRAQHSFRVEMWSRLVDESACESRRQM